MKTFSLLAFGILLASSTAAFAVPVQPAPVEEVSPALQMARRVASMENGKDLPSRAVWLGKKAARNSRLAYGLKTETKHAKKKTSSAVTE
ncbi:MAG: hypothetical protein ACXVB9_06235 [Bdellovibrionota bacterium]